MSELNDLILPIIDPNEDVWVTFFRPEDLTSLRSLLYDLQQPMLGMGGIYPVDLEERMLITLKIVVDSEDVSCSSFFSCSCNLFS